MSDTDIFIKKTEIIKENIKFSKNEIIKSIPHNHLKKENLELQKIKIEWRWRIYKIPNHKNDIVEISFKKPNEKRQYINKHGNWVEYDLTDDLNKYIIDEFYVY